MLTFYTRRQFYLLFIAGLVCLFSSFYLDRNVKPIIAESEENKVKEKFKSHLDKEMDLMKAFFENKNHVRYSEFSSDGHYSIQVYKADSMVFWNNNSIEPIYTSISDRPIQVKTLNNGIYLSYTYRSYDTTFQLYYLIRNNFQINNSYLKNNLNPDFDIKSNCEIESHSKTGYTEIVLKDGTLLYVQFELPPHYSAISFFLFLIGLLFVFISLRYPLYDFFRIDFVLGLSLLIVAAVIVRVVMVKYHYPAYLYGTEIFNPHYFASSDFLESFGDLLVTVLLLAGAILTASYYLKRLKEERLLIITNTGKAFLLFYIFNSTFFTFKIIHALVSDSRISFDLTNAFELSWLSLAGVIVIIIMYLVTISLAHIFSQEYTGNKLFNRNNTIQFVLVLLMVILLRAAQGDSFKWDWEKIYIAALFLGLLVLARRVFLLDGFLLRHLTYALIFVNVAAVSFYLEGNDKELQDQISYANRLTTQIDYKAEEILNAKEHSILVDSNFIRNCLSGSENNIVANRYITVNYINNYLEKYDCSVYLFLNDSANNSVSNYSQNDLETIYKNQGVSGLSGNFRFVKSPAEFFGYIGRFEIQREDTNLKIYIILKLQPYQEDNLLPILLADRTTTFKRNKLRYSYAIYNNNKLMQQAGIYQYPAQNNFDKPQEEYLLINKDGYSHLLFKDSGELIVVVSSQVPSLLSILANALCLYIIAILIGIVLFFLDFIIILVFQTQYEFKLIRKLRSAWLVTRKKYEILNFRFSTRMVINILGLVLFIFIATSVFTLQYIDNKINDEARTALIVKLKSINKYFSENKLLLESDSVINEEANLLKASSLFATDINIYNAKGKLYVSSKPEIFKEGLLSEYINYNAYNELVYHKASLFTQNEKIGELKYTSYYQPYYDKNNDLKYIINTPYFARTLEHNAQISMFIVNFLNLYVALLIIMFMISYWVAHSTTQPFILLRDKIKSLRLDKENELLTWNRNDEIGELIRQYNSMVLDLKESKLNLANAERTEAWREMAKQVAHDIKNPLTPMKLNLQYLQKAVEENDDQLFLKFKSVSVSLIKQIDSLTEMANNFSSFAKSPDANPEMLSINDEVLQIAEIYKATDSVLIIPVFDANTPMVWMDQNHFTRSLGNILKNAIQSIPQGREGKIRIEVSSTQDECMIVVKDNGSGISASMEHLIFVPNFSTKSSGSGLGLSIVKTFVENAGGTISFTSSDLEGTAFTMKFPRYTEPNPA